MASVNKVIVLGNLGKDPEIKYTAGGQAVCNFTVATNEKWTDKAGQKQEKAEWHRVVAWGKLAELCGEYLAKGRSVYVEGKIQTREWSDKAGVKHYSTEIVAREVQFLGAKGEARAESPGTSSGPPPAAFDEPARGPGPTDDDIPF